MFMTVVLIGVGTVGLIAFMSLTNVFQGRFGIRQRLFGSKGKSLSAIEIAQDDLLERAKKGDWSTVLGSNQMQNHVNVGLVIPDASTYTRLNPVPRFTINDSKSSIRIYYEPELVTGQTQSTYPAYYPKHFNVYIETENTESGEKQTVASKVKVDAQRTSDFTVAIMGDVNFTLPPGQYSGPKYFAATTDAKFGFGGFYWPWTNTIPTGYSNVDFSGPTYTKLTTVNSSNWTVQKNASNQKIIGLPSTTDFVTNVDYQILTTPSAWNTQASTEATSENTSNTNNVLLNSDIGTGHICLLFNGQTITKHACNNDNPLPEARYGTVQATYSSSTLPKYIYCDNCELHIKGTLSQSLSIATTGNVWIEGDIQYTNQSDDSNIVFSLATTKDIIIPSTVPNRIYPHISNTADTFSTDSAYPSKASNFVINGDRDGTANVFGNLDLDGAYYADGWLRIQGANGTLATSETATKTFSTFSTACTSTSTSPCAQTVYTSTGVAYLTRADATFGATMSFFNSSAGTWALRGNPVLCRPTSFTSLSVVTNPEANTTNCAKENIIVRQYSLALNVFGSMVTKYMDQFNIEGQGFIQFNPRWDSRLMEESLFGIPKLNQSKAVVLWQKNIEGFNKDNIKFPKTNPG